MPQIDLARKWFKEFCLPVLREDFPDLLPRLAAGIAGRGSECYGFDDEYSADHDFNGGIYLWISDEDERKYGFPLMRSYSRLLKEHPFAGKSPSSRQGGEVRGVTVIGDFFRRHLGFPGVPENWQQWLYTPEYAFSEVTNGSVFIDDAGIFSRIREQISCGMPEDVRRKKFAYHSIMMAQSGQYNFLRCLKHKEAAAAAIALNEFVIHAAAIIYLFNNSFAPYYKWLFRGMRDLPFSGEAAGKLETLLTEDLPGKEKAAIIEDIAAVIAGKLVSGNWSSASGTYLEDHAYSIVSGIRDREIRALHIMEG